MADGEKGQGKEESVGDLEYPTFFFESIKSGMSIKATREKGRVSFRAAVEKGETCCEISGQSVGEFNSSDVFKVPKSLHTR